MANGIGCTVEPMNQIAVARAIAAGDRRPGMLALCLSGRLNLANIPLGDPFADFRDASKSKNPEHNKFGGEPLEKGEPNHHTRIVEGDLAMIGLLGGISQVQRGLNLATGRVIVKRTITACGASAGNDGPHAGQHGDVDAAGVRAFSEDDAENIHHDRSSTEDKLHFSDVGATDGLSATRKRMRPSTMPISPAAALDVMPEPELEDAHLAKRRRSAERQAENVCSLAAALDSSPVLMFCCLPAANWRTLFVYA
ncbi:hypothetical protein BU23DRAFT_568865 [Bimuria novae-zelandiae CBS 107.79]|uniref:Uncharacterized protein n=1 Tax=Bimuria novae-zelandiae CBS 107.79 TaxID=1447943 RepID=A0A6A5V8P4_9PLEO|nr:hypothetical protein BU23DRAFT_568865 [Bimuria novae-zelandiae CBS 107.79]